MSQAREKSPSRTSSSTLAILSDAAQVSRQSLSYPKFPFYYIAFQVIESSASVSCSLMARVEVVEKATLRLTELKTKVEDVGQIDQARSDLQR